MTVSAVVPNLAVLTVVVSCASCILTAQSMMLKFVETVIRVNDPFEKAARELQKEVKAGVHLLKVLGLFCFDKHDRCRGHESIVL